jgi:uncharacterized membrane protein YdbT with pleckstrin-like domain
MQQPFPYYKEEINSLNSELKSLKRQLRTTSILRLLTFLSISFSIYFAITNNNFFFGVSFLLIVLFVYLITKHTRLQQQKKTY